MSNRVAAIREFNRFYTNRIGVVRQGYLKTRWSLTEARVLYELAQVDGLEVAALRAELEIDPGQLSRVLTRLEDAGAVRRSADPRDRRRQVARLTARGRRAFTTLDSRSARETSALLDRISEHDQRRLVAAMNSIRGILGDGAAPEVRVRVPEPGDLGWMVERHGALYAREYDWDESFEALVAEIVAGYAKHHEPEREAVWIAEAAGERVGCVMCVSKSRTVAQLRLLLVEPHARGMGIGGRLVQECLDFARGAGYRRIVLWTNDPLIDARALYERFGFTLVSEGRHRAFGHEMAEQTWQLEL